MIGIKQLKRGAVLRVTAAGETHILEIVDMKDGRVIFAKPGIGAKHGKGRWALPIAHVRANSELWRKYR